MPTVIAHDSRNQTALMLNSTERTLQPMIDAAPHQQAEAPTRSD
jgi:hypothetical protein